MTYRLLAALSLVSFLAACADMQDGALSEQDSANVQTAEKMEQNGNLAGAAMIYRTIAARPEAPMAISIKLADIYRKLNRSDEAIALLRQAQTKSPDNAHLLNQLGYALVDARQPEEAVNVFDRLITMEPENALHYNGKAVAFDHAGNHIAAQEIYQQALSLAPDSPAIQNNLAMSMILNSQYEEAIILLEALMRKSDANATMRHNLALAYGLMGDRERALEVGGKDLSPEQARANLKFYEEYGKMRKRN